MTALLLSYAVKALAMLALVTTPLVAYTRARAGAPLVPVNRYVIVWAVLLFLSILYYLPGVLAGPKSGQNSCVFGSLTPGCVFWTLFVPALNLLWPLLLAPIVYLAAYVFVRLAPASLEARFERWDRALQETSRSDAERTDGRR